MPSASLSNPRSRLSSTATAPVWCRPSPRAAATSKRPGVLADLERRAELVKAKVMTAGEDAAARHQDTPFAKHVDAYVGSLEATGARAEHRQERRRQLRRLAADCGLRTLAGLRALACRAGPAGDGCPHP